MGLEDAELRGHYSRQGSLVDIERRKLTENTVQIPLVTIARGQEPETALHCSLGTRAFSAQLRSNQRLPRSVHRN